MKRIIVFISLVTLIAGYVYSKENLAILPFTGGQEDEGETIAELFSFNDRINDVFSPIPRTSITQAIRREQRFQMSSGMTDADTIVAIGHQLGARYVVAGNITSVGSNKLLVISIMDVGNLQQIAGDYQTYTNMADIRRELPNMARNIIQATERNTASLPKLAIIPVQLQGGADQRLADTLTQILSIHIIRSGKYTVYPRTRSLEQVMEEHRIQFSGITDDSSIIGVGYGENPNLVLAVAARRLENINMFNAAIINLFTGAQVVGRYADYRDINDGIRAMETLSINLTSTSDEIDQRENEAEQQRLRDQQAAERQRLRDQQKAKREAYWAGKSRYATRNYYEMLSGYLQWGDDAFGGGGSMYASAFNFSPFSFTSLGIESRLGFFDGFYGSGAITVGLVYPFNERLKIFADYVLEMGYFGGLNGRYAGWATPGFDIGLSFFEDELAGFSIKYRGTWYDGYYTHSVGIGWIWVEW
jgi:TolB-like protein